MLCALGVRGTGRSMSRRIARYFATTDDIRTADTAAMQQVEGIGTENAPSQGWNPVCFRISRR